MLIKNRFGRIVDVKEDLAIRMVRKGEAVLYDQTPKQKEVNLLECPYCKKVLKDEESLEEHKRNCNKRALISVIIPSRTNEEIETLESLKNQTFNNIEVIIVKDINKEGASVCRNRGFKKARGQYILFSDNDIEWQPNALAVLYQTLLDNPKASYAYPSYTLEGRLVGDREFSTHDLWKWNYISTMALLRREDFPGFDESISRFQDWDLWLTLLEAGKEGKYCGKCLFKTKAREGITYGKEALPPQKAREIILKKHSISNKKLADIVIPHQNRHDLLKDTLDKISYDLYNVYVITGGTFSHNCNKGAKIADSENIIFMNDDLEPNETVINEMIRNKADIVGASQITPNWHPDKTYYGIDYEWKNDFINESITDDLKKVLIPTGFLFRVKRKVWEELGGFSEEFKNGGEDQDLFLRALEQGYTFDIVETPTIHHHSSSRDRFKHTSDNRTLLNKVWTKDRIKKILDNHSKQLKWREKSKE